LRIDDLIPGNDEPNLLPQLNGYIQNRKIEQVKTQSLEPVALQKFSTDLGRIHRLAPHLEPGVVLALAKSNASDQTIAKVGMAAISVERQKADEIAEQEKNNRGFFGKVYSKFKTGIRYGVGVADTYFDLLNQLPSSFVSASDNPQSGNVFDFDLKNPFRKGWWASTALGSMMSGEESGEGFFIGGAAAEGQQRRLNDFAGQIPITIEAGAAENTAYEPSPEEIRQLAVQIVDSQGISFEEAYELARVKIRSEATIPITFGGTNPLYLPRIETLKTPTGGSISTGLPRFRSFKDIGSSEYALQAATATVALGFATPDPVSKAVQISKPLIAYSRGIKNVDEVGNFVMDTRFIAETGVEAEFLSRVDAMNAVVNDYEVSALRVQDEAIEMATPQPGVWYHGSHGGGVPGNVIYDIGDPRYPTPEGNLLGPGFYMTEEPVIAQSYARSPDRTRTITPEEEETLRSVPGAISDTNLQLGLPLEQLGPQAEGIPAAVYRLQESEGAAPVFLDGNYGLRTQLPPETIEKIASLYFDTESKRGEIFSNLFREDSFLSQLFEKTGISNLFENVFQKKVEAISDVAFVGGGWYSGTPGPDRFTLDTSWKKAVTENPELVNNIQFVPPSVIADRAALLVENFIEVNNRRPSSIEELFSFKPNIDSYLFSVGEDSLNFFRNADFTDVINQFLAHGNTTDEFFIPTIGSFDEMLRGLNVQNYRVNLGRANLVDETAIRLPTEAIQRGEYKDIQKLYGDLFKYIFKNIDSKFENRLSSLDLPTNTRVGVQQSLGVNQGTFIIGAFNNSKPVSLLELNNFLFENGIDGWTHQGGRIVGAERGHRVRVYFDPMKHLDVTDPLTGERLPINEAINLQRESGELYNRAGEIRNEIDELNMMLEAGHIPGYGSKVDPEKFNTFFTQSRAGRYAADKIWEVVERFNGKGMVSDSDVWYELFTMFSGRIPLEDLDEILRATSKSEMIGIINKKVGYTPGLANIGDLNFSLSKTFDKLKEVSRMDVLFENIGDIFGPVLSRSPRSKHLNFYGTEREKLQALQDLDDFMETGIRGRINKTVEIKEGTLTQKNLILYRFAKAMQSNDKTAMFDASSQLASAISRRILSETGDEKQAQLASDLWKNIFETASGYGLYNVGEEGLRIDNGYAVAIAEGLMYSDPVKAGRLISSVHGGPGLLSELQRSPLELPDVQALRRMTSIIGVLTGKQGFQRVIKKSELRTNFLKQFGVDLSQKDLEKLGELRLPLRAADFMMTKVWKSAKKFQFAYALRNTMEAQARLAFDSKDNIFTHPLDHILVSTFNRLPDDIALGEEFNPGGWRNIGLAHQTSGEGYKEMLGNAFYGSDARFDMVNSRFRNGGIDVFSKDKPKQWAKAGGYELRQLFNDPIARRLANGADVDTVIKWLYGGSDDANKSLRELENLVRNGEVFYTGQARTPEVIPVDPTPVNIRKRIETQQQARLSLKTGGDSELMEVVSTGRFRGEDAFDGSGNASGKLLKYIEENIGTDLPEFYKGPGESTLLAGVQKNWFDKTTSFVFDNLVGRAHNQLDRSPLWRQEYTKEINRLAPLLSAEAAAELKEILITRTAHYNTMAKSKKIAREFTLKDYVGRNVDADELMESLDNAKGALSREEIHVIANSLTLNRIENLLFDATARNSFTDAARIVSPFNAAFFEVTKKWFTLMAENPDKLVNASRKFGYLAGEKAPNELGENKGILHKDPITGDYMYGIPMSGTIARLFNRLVGDDTGADYSLRAPVKGLNMAFSFTPGFGPLVGYPLGKLMYSSPKLRDYATFFLPYGQPKSPLDPTEYLPGFLNKAFNAAINNPNAPGVYGDTVNDVARAELATGKWNIDDPEEFEEFQNDVESKSTVLTILRSIGQFFGPSSPQLKIDIQTKSGDVMAGFLTAEFHELQSQDYDSAVERFLYMFGDEAFAYMAGKTREVYMGTEATSEFARWELENSELFDSTYGEIAGFFGPKGSDFDWAAWNYQTNKGMRERIPYKEQIAIAQQIFGLHKYRRIVEAAGPKPNEQQTAFLEIQKAKLEKEYPGMVSQSSFDVQKFPKQIKLMEQAIADPRLAGNETAIQLKKYLNIRNMYITAADSSLGGWNSDRAKILKADLRYRAGMMIEETPEFARIFERILLNELDR
jgi:hypothetical protein